MRLAAARRTGTSRSVPLNRCIEGVVLVKTPSISARAIRPETLPVEKSGSLHGIRPRIEAGTPETNCHPLIIKPIG